jgi:hypothetical protein
MRLSSISNLNIGSPAEDEVADLLATFTPDRPGWRTEPDGPEKDEAFIHGYLPISRISEARSRKRRGRASDLVDEAAFDLLFARQISDLWLEYSGRASDQIRALQERGLARIINSVLAPTGISGASPASAASAAEAYEAVRTFFGSQELGRYLHLSKKSFAASYKNNPLAREVVSELAEVQRGIDQAQEPQRKIEDLLTSMYSGGKTVGLQGRTVTVTIGETEVPLESLSSGEKQLMQLLLECLAARDNPVIIDEPELSLHVDWQNRMVRILQTVNESAQLIMATHSPEVMARLADPMIIEL